MELRHLRYFVAVAEELHFSRAAAKLNIATPTLSSQIQALEALLGAQLFTRKTRSVALTHVGKRFLEEARLAVKQVEQAELVGRRAAHGDVGSIAAGYILSAACGGIVASSITDFKNSHPDVSFLLRKMETFPQLNALIDGSLDIGFTRGLPRYPTGLTGFLVDSQPLWVAMPAGHRLASHDMIKPEMLAGEPLVVTLLEMEVGFWGNVAAVTPPELSPRIVARVPDAFSMLTLVATGIGMAVLSESLKRICIPGVVFRKIIGTSRDADHVVVFRRNEGSPVVQAFIAMLRTKMRNAEKASDRVAS
ncbi:MAG TPA: LysR substrate-binding domain-containing protein [Xanthobacteraceae bacterium]|jgi:DNA-binding transcriptional LysR family regulator